ncbi:MAG TPA: hypothetical protein EYN66_11930 [Myxococcales bacterium]|nr:hypothetical protein [Myxococcales bacterium]
MIHTYEVLIGDAVAASSPETAIRLLLHMLDEGPVNVRVLNATTHELTHHKILNREVQQGDTNEST